MGTGSSNWGNVGFGFCRGNINWVGWRQPEARAEGRKEREVAATIFPARNREKAGNAALVPALPHSSSCSPRCGANMTQD